MSIGMPPDGTLPLDSFMLPALIDTLTKHANENGGMITLPDAIGLIGRGLMTMLPGTKDKCVLPFRVDQLDKKIDNANAEVRKEGR